MAAINEWLAAGAAYGQVGWTDKKRRVIGQFATGSSNIARLSGISVIPYALDNPQIEKQLADNGHLLPLVGDIQDNETFVLEVAMFNQTFRRMADGYTTRDTFKKQQITPIVSRGANRPCLYLLFSRDALSNRGEITQASAGYEHLEIFAAECVYLGSGHAFQEAASWRFLVICHESWYAPDGRTVSAAFDNSTDVIPDGKLAAVERYTEYPLSVYASSSMSVNAFQVLYPPIDIAHTYAVIDGTETTVTSVDPSTKNIEVADTPSSDPFCCYYQTTSLE